MKINEIRPAAGSKTDRRRIGRGEGSGWGRCAGRGDKGQKARSGGGVPLGFEGGQMPLQRRVPKRGFRNERFQQRYAEVRLDALNRFSEGSEIREADLREAGLMKGMDKWAKVLGSGQLDRRVTLRVSKVTSGARKAIEAAGGSVEEP